MAVNSDTCHNCGGRGHYTRQCPSEKANNAQQEEQEVDAQEDFGFGKSCNFMVQDHQDHDTVALVSTMQDKKSLRLHSCCSSHMTDYYDLKDMVPFVRKFVGAFGANSTGHSTHT